VGESIQHFQRAADLLPEDPDAAYNLGAALLLEGRLDEAAAQLRRALRLKPDYVEAADKLGGVLVLQGRIADAVEQFRRAVALSPADSRLRFRLAMALVGLGGHGAEVADDLRQVVREQPDWPEPVNALAWLLATSPDPVGSGPGEALHFARRAVELTDARDPRVLDTLAAAQAAAGQFDEAVQTARRAGDLADRAQAATLARQIRERMALYARGKPYRESPTVQAAP
jgi:Flp pilus assembly protein TadD